MTKTEKRSDIPTADKARFHSWGIDAELAEIMELAEEGELSEDARDILARANQSLHNLHRALSELKNNVKNDGTDSA